jgi:hypothetical protein
MKSSASGETDLLHIRSTRSVLSKWSPAFQEGRFEAESVFCQEGRNNKCTLSVAGSHQANRTCALLIRMGSSSESGISALIPVLRAR